MSIPPLKRLTPFLLTVCCTLFAAFPLFAQEICNNGIDDDGDGLIDCYDADCAQQGPCAGFFYGYPVYHCDMQPPVGPFGMNLVWTSTVNVSTRSTALVADVDNDGVPEVIVHRASPDQLYILDGVTGAVEVTITCPAILDYSDALTVADTDNDGFGEIYALDANFILHCFEHTGAPKAGYVPPNIGVAEGGPNIADFNGDGNPEVYFGNRIYNSQTGALIASGGAGSKGVNPNAVAWHSAAGDLLPAIPGLELACGNTVYAVDIAAGTLTPQPNNLGALPDGFTSLADMNMDGLLDVVVTYNGNVYVWNPVSGNQFGPTFNIPNTTTGGRPNVADYDNDGQPEIGVGGSNRYVVIDFDIPTLTLSQLWINTTVDGSQMTTGSAFDFEGDGITEVVYRDENTLFIYDGATGNVKASIPCGSGTRTEFPTVADVDGDGSANIICNCATANQGSTGKTRVYSSAGIPWIDTRSVMNQHGYSIVNINDDLSVPTNQQNTAQIPAINRFISQVPIFDVAWNPIFVPIPDLTVAVDTVEVCNTVNMIDVTITACNIGSNNVTAPFPVSFYNGNPSVGGTLISTANFTTLPLDTPTCATQTFSVAWNNAAFTLYVLVNDDGSSPANAPELIFIECDSTNNAANYPVVPVLIQPEITGFGAGYCPENMQVALTGTPAGGAFSGTGMSGSNFNPQTAGEGQHVITYTYTHGVCVFDTTEQLTVYAKPVADFSANTVCAGNQTNFTDQSTVSNSFISTWDWNFGPGIPHSADQNAIYIYNTANLYNVSLTVTSDDGCVDDTIIPVRVHVNPVADFEPASYCLNDTAYFVDNSSIPSGNIVSWMWSFGNGFFGSAQDTIYVYQAAGNYTAGIQVTSDSGCVDTHVEQIVVSNLPIADFTFMDICEDEQAQFNDESIVVGGNIQQWEWDFDDGSGIYNGQNPPLHDFPGWGPYNVQLIVTSGGSCKDTSTQMIGVYPLPTAEFVANTVCYGTQTVFNDLSDIPYGNIESWTWTFNDNGVTTNNSNPIYTFSTYGLFDVNLEVSSDFGCVTDTTIPVRVHPVAAVDFSANTVCFGDVTSFTDLSTIPQGNIVSWDWNFNDGGTSTLQNAFHTYQNPGLFNVNLTVTTDSACVTDTIREIEVYPLPDVDFVADVVEGCQPLSINFTDLSIVNPGYLINWWFWDFGDGNTATVQHPMHIYDTAGVFDITLQAKTSNGCTVVYTDSAMITVHPKPKAGFSTSSQRVEIIYPRFEITDLSSGASFWQYDFGDSTTSAARHPVHVYDETGGYEIRQIVTTDFGCKDTTYFTVYVDPSFTFYVPNAFSPNGDGHNDFFFGTGIGIERYQLRIFNRWGEMVFSSFDENVKWDGTLPGGDLAKQDVYVYRFDIRDVFTNDHTYRGRVTLLVGEPQE